MIPLHDLSRAQWRKSTRSGGNGQCVELAATPDAMAVRDSKDPYGPKLTVSRTAWRVFSERAKNGAYDL